MTYKAYIDLLGQIKDEGRLRELPRQSGDTTLLDLCSNDYMGLGANYEDLTTQFHEEFGYPPMTSSASRLLQYRSDWHTAFETYLESRYGKPALLFNSGYHANAGIIQALNLPGTLWLADKLIHASAIDGLRLAGADVKRWRHNDTAQLEKLIDKADGYDRIIIVAESIYSMDGDAAPIKELVEIKRKHPNALLYLDEAHAIGVFGNTGLGLTEQEGIINEADFLIGTLGKGVGSAGAFAVLSPLLKDFLVNTCRSLIFSTALPPANAAWSHFMMRKLETMTKERWHLHKLSEIFREGIERITGHSNPSVSPIVPCITGHAAEAVEISSYLKKNGILALPIRRPTVPPGGERIRFSLNATLTEDEISGVLDTLAGYYISKERK